jgi:protein TonB
VQLIDLPRPAYPAQARRLHLEGEVVVMVEVAADGSIRSTVLRHGSGYAVLDEAAVAAVARAHFAPALDHGLPVAAAVEVPVRFRLVEGG